MGKKITTIFEQPLDNGRSGILGIDEDANLYWNNKPVVTRGKLALSWWVNLSIVIGGFSTFILAILAIGNFFK